MAYPLTELWLCADSPDEGWGAAGFGETSGVREHVRRGPPAEPADHVLVGRLREDDVGAYAELFDRFAPKLWRFAARQMGSVDLAQDVVQDVFVAVWERRRMLDADMNLNAYLYGAVRRRGLHLLRHERSRERIAQAGADSAASWRAVAPIVPDEAAQAAELEAALAAALAPLSELQRSALALRRAGLSHAEIAAALDITTEAARKHVSRGLSSLQTVLARFAADRG